MTLLVGFVLGMSAGLRSMTPIAIVAWAAQLGWPELRATSLAFMAAPVTAWVFTLFACIELVFDKLPFTPSRLGAGPLGVRILSGALCSATVCAAAHQPVAIRRGSSARSAPSPGRWPATTAGDTSHEPQVSALLVASPRMRRDRLAAFAALRML